MKPNPAEIGQYFTQKVNNVKGFFHETPLRVQEHARENKALYITAAIALLGLAVVEAPYSQGVASFFDHLLSGVLAIPLWELPAEQGLTEMLKTPDGIREIAKFVAIDGGLGIAANFVHKFARSISTDKRLERALLGVEPIGTHDKPRHVFIGPSDISSDMARRLFEGNPSKKNKPVVVIHTDNQIPARFSQEVDYHFKLSCPEELLDTFPRGKQQFIDVAGVCDADELTFICVNPQNAIYYGSSGAMDFPPDFVSSVLKKIPPNKLKGKKVNVMAPQIFEMGGLASIKSELVQLSKELGFTLIYKTPEEMLMNETADKSQSLRDKLASIAQRIEGNTVSVVLVGQAGGSNMSDSLMLKAFAKAISQLNIDKKIKVDIVRRLDSDEEPIESGILKKAHYILCYGNTDTGTTSLIRMLLSDENLGIDKDRIGAVIEKINQMFDVDLSPANVFLIYDMMLKAFSSHV